MRRTEGSPSGDESSTQHRRWRAASLLLALAACAAPRADPPGAAGGPPATEGSARTDGVLAAGPDGGEASRTPAPVEPQAPEAGAPASPPPARAQPPVRLPSVAGWVPSGSLSLRYRGRATGDDDDHELRGLLTLDLVNPDAPRVSAHVVARGDLDLDGFEKDSVFEDLSDTYDTSLVGKLYLAYADVVLGDLDRPLGTLRAGRQSDARLPEVLRLDGGAFTSRRLGAKEVELGLYGGLPVHLYDVARDGDVAYGSWLEARPWRGARARLDWMHIEDERVLGAAKDDLWALGLWQDLSRRWRVEGQHTRIEGAARDVTARATFQDPESETVARLSYFELLEPQRFRPLELDPFYEILLDHRPYRQATASVSRGLGEHLLVDLGYDLRRVSQDADQGEFNRDWERAWGTATLRDVLAEGLSLALTGERWDDDDRDVGSLGADLSYRDDAWSGSLGTYWSLYKYRLLELEEREEVRTWYLRGTRKLSPHLRLELGYELEDDDLEVYHTVRGGLLWRF